MGICSTCQHKRRMVVAGRWKMVGRWLWQWREGLQHDRRSPSVHVGVPPLARSNPGSAIKSPFSTSCASGRLFLEPRSRREESQMSWITWSECPAVLWMEQRQQPFRVAISKRLPQWAAGLQAHARGHTKKAALRQKQDGGVKLYWRRWNDVALFKCGKFLVSLFFASVNRSQVLVTIQQNKTSLRGFWAI